MMNVTSETAPPGEWTLLYTADQLRSVRIQCTTPEVDIAVRIASDASVGDALNSAHVYVPALTEREFVDLFSGDVVLVRPVAKRAGSVSIW